MHNLEINFLKDRNLGIISQQTVEKKKPTTKLGQQVPLIAGLVAMVLLPASAMGFKFGLQAQKTKITQELAAAEAKIQQFQRQNQKIKKLKEELKEIEAENTALVTVFNRIKPWSALLRELGAKIPAGVQIDAIAQAEGSGKNANNNQITIEGMARSYNNVNDFLLLLQNSRFLEGENTYISKAELVDFPIDISEPETTASQEKLNRSPALNQLAIAKIKKENIEFPQGIKYTITTVISDTPASKILGELESKGAVGLATRIRNLQRKGAIK